MNDPVLLHVDENRWWMQLADSDAGLYALGVATGLGLDVEVSLPRRAPDAGPGTVLGQDAREARRLRRSTTSSTTGASEFEIDGIPVRHQPDRVDRRSPGSR